MQCTPYKLHSRVTLSSLAITAIISAAEQDRLGLKPIPTTYQSRPTLNAARISQNKENVLNRHPAKWFLMSPGTVLCTTRGAHTLAGQA